MLCYDRIGGIRMEYVKVIALFLFIFFLIMQIWFGQKAKVIAYFFFIISAALYVMNFNIESWLKYVILIAILLIVMSSLHFENKAKNAEADHDYNSKQQTFADKNRKRKK